MRHVKRLRSGAKKSTNHPEDEWMSAPTPSAHPSTRAPRLRTIPRLTQSAISSLARAYPLLASDPSWSAAHAALAPHLAATLRDAILEKHQLTTERLASHAVPPHLYLPGSQSCVADAKLIKPLKPAPTCQVAFTSLTLTHASLLSDTSIAELVWALPSLEQVNLKGCTHAGSKTAAALLRCKSLTEINLRATKVNDADVRALLKTFGHQLVKLKLDSVQLSDETFASAPYPRIERLCLPGDVVRPRAAETHARAVARAHGQVAAYPAPLAARPGAIFDFARLGEIFPALTHLTLPGLALHHDSRIILPANTLVKFSIGPAGPPVPVRALTELVNSQIDSLRAVHLGHLYEEDSRDNELRELGVSLKRCALVDFRLEADPRGSGDVRCDNAMYMAIETFSGISTWRNTLVRLVLRIPRISAGFLNQKDTDFASSTDYQFMALENLALPGVDLFDPHAIAREIGTDCPALRSLDLSATAIETSDIFEIMDCCPLLDTIDLTACRGVNVRMRRRIFEAWVTDRNQQR